jgi:hypothetical protein
VVEKDNVSSCHMAEVEDSGKGYLRTATIVPDHILKGQTVRR